MTSNVRADGRTRTTLTGQPIAYKHDALTNVAVGDAGFVGGGAAGANLLPHGYTDDSIVRIPLKISDIEGEQPPAKQEKKKGLMRRLSNAISLGDKASGEIRVVTMTRGDYLKHWAKGEDGKFLPTVEEPSEGRKEWVRKQLEDEVQKRPRPGAAA